ncbi:MAG: alpha/beta fold hydrolase [Bacteroidota bacterium]
MKLFFRSFGEGAPMVILHGLFGISDNWVTFGKRISERYHVFIPDLRNHGQSPHSEVFDLPSLTEDLFEFAEYHDLEKMIVLGHSLGGKTAMDFALKYPEIVSHLIVVDIGMRRYGGDRDHQGLINAMMEVDLSICATRSDLEKQLAEKIHSVKLRQFLMKNIYWRGKTTLAWRLNLSVINNNLPLIHEGVNAGTPFKGPALFIRGAESDYVIDNDLILIKENFPMATIKTISGASHWVHADAPEAFYQAINDFLSRQS